VDFNLFGALEGADAGLDLPGGLRDAEVDELYRAAVTQEDVLP